MFKLVISDDEGKTTVVPLIREEITIGRKEGNTIRLTDRNVSRFHARVIRRDDDFVIEDLGSLCGTNVNNEVLRSDSHVIATGDNISIGDYSLSIRSDVGSDVPMGKQMDPGDQAGIGKVTSCARLVMLAGPEPGREVELTAELYVIGRSDEANFRIEHPSISRAHARIDLESGKWTISDLDSSNGIEINGAKKDDYVLKAGDIVLLGTVQLRFVAPGEPYEYAAPGGGKQKTEEHGATVELAPERIKSKGKAVALVIGAVAAASLAIAGIILLRQNGGDAVDAAEAADDVETFESLIEDGKDKMQAEEWGEAARLFALAHQKDPDNEVARELKTMAIQESDAQTAFKSGLAAQENQNWEEAVKYLSQIPRSSHYYDIEQFRIVSGKLCDELLEKASFINKTGSRFDLEKVIDDIFAIPEAPLRCKGPKEKLLWRIREHTLSGVDDSGLNDKDLGLVKKRHRGVEEVKKGRGRSRGRQPRGEADGASSGNRQRPTVESKVEWGNPGKSNTQTPASKLNPANPYESKPKRPVNPYE